MNPNNISRQKNRRFADPVYYYVFCAAVIVFSYMAFHVFLRRVYEYLLMVPCFMFVGAMVERKVSLKGKGHFVLPFAMAGWFLTVMIKRSLDLGGTVEIGLDLLVYLFAFPLATLLQDGDEKKALKMFAWAYLAAAAVLTIESMLLAVNCLPAFLAEHVYWDGGRLVAFWHPNVTGCYLMIGIVFCTTFISSAKSVWTKLGLCVLLVMMFGAIALSRCRTAIILTGGYLGALAFFMIIKRGIKWFLPGVAVVLALLVGFYVGATRFYQANYDALIERYTQQYIEQTANETVNEIQPEPEKSAKAEKPAKTEETAKAEKPVKTEESVKTETKVVEEAPPVVVNQNTGEVELVTTSPQGTIEKDIGTFNNRSRMWQAAFVAIRENPSILIWGVANPGRFVSDYWVLPVTHLHNAWVECLVGLGAVGFLIAVLITLITAWNCLIILLKHHKDIWKRNLAILTLCILVSSFLEPYLFYTSVDYHLIELLFFLCAGYLAHWQEADNSHILSVVRGKLRLKQ